MQLSEALNAKREICSALGFRDVQARPEEPRVSVGISLPQQSQRVFHIAIRARSCDDLELARAEGRLDVLESYPDSEVDIRITGPIVAPRVLERTVAKKRLSIGASIGHYCCTGGSLGFFARRTADGTLGMVSNNHVLAAADEGLDGDDILHPRRADHGSRELDVVGYLAGDYPRLDDDAPIVDCAFARLRDGILYDAVTIGPDLYLKADAAPLELQCDVLKRGRSTGLTRGRVTAFAMDHCEINFDFTSVFLDQQIEIESIDDEPFSMPGDSGSLVVNPDGHPVGLLVANSLDRLHYASSIENVLKSLGVTVLT
ncbi:MAG TPA: hypothetical protein VE974_10580 [Thermoanaerobaculia bacterium]|nr:hypothetical protein [Thermoanaerobaculia bacterium]